MRRQPIVKSLTVIAALSACAVAAPTAFASTDIPPPDTSKAVVVTQQPSTSSNDLRTPDAKAAAADPRAQTYATPTVIKVGFDSGFDWGDAGIGAGGMLAAVALA